MSADKGRCRTTSEGDAVSVVSRHVRSYARADCPTCGWEPAKDSDNPQFSRRQAARHAAATGHRTHLTTETTRVYEVQVR